MGASSLDGVPASVNLDRLTNAGRDQTVAITIEEGRVTSYGTTSCHCRSDGTIGKRSGCLTCEGSGRGPRGGRRGCRSCHGSGNAYDVERETCPRCAGTRTLDADRFAYWPKDQLDTLRAIPIAVVRQDRGSSFNELHLGVGRVYSLTDYGRSNKTSDDDLTSEIRDRLGGQICAFVDRNDRLATRLVAIVTRDGHSLAAVFDAADTDATLARAEHEVDPQTAHDGRSTPEIIGQALGL